MEIYSLKGHYRSAKWLIPELHWYSSESVSEIESARKGTEKLLSGGRIQQWAFCSIWMTCTNHSFLILQLCTPLCIVHCAVCTIVQAVIPVKVKVKVKVQEKGQTSFYQATKFNNGAHHFYCNFFWRKVKAYFLLNFEVMCFLCVKFWAGNGVNKITNMMYGNIINHCQGHNGPRVLTL